MTTQKSSGASGTNPLERWINGVVLYPIVPIGMGICCLVWNTARIPGDPEFGGGELILHGSQATAAGIACIALGMGLHFHFFWSHHPAWPIIGHVGEVASSIVCLACVLYVFFSFWVGP